MAIHMIEGRRVETDAKFVEAATTQGEHEIHRIGCSHTQKKWFKRNGHFCSFNYVYPILGETWQEAQANWESTDNEFGDGVAVRGPDEGKEKYCSMWEIGYDVRVMPCAKK